MRTDAILNSRRVSPRSSGAGPLGENRKQDFQIDRFEHVVIETRCAGPLAIVVLAEAGDRDQGRFSQHVFLLKGLRKLVAVHAG